MLSRLMYTKFHVMTHLFQFNRIVSHKMPTFSLLGYVAGFSQLKTNAQHELTQKELEKITEYYHFTGKWSVMGLDLYQRLKKYGMSPQALREKKIAMSREIIALIESKSPEVRERQEIKVRLISAYETLIRLVHFREKSPLLFRLEQLDSKNSMVLRWHGGSDMFPEVKSDYEMRKALRESKAENASSDTEGASMQLPDAGVPRLK